MIHKHVQQQSHCYTLPSGCFASFHLLVLAIVWIEYHFKKTCHIYTFLLAFLTKLEKYDIRFSVWSMEIAQQW